MAHSRFSISVAIASAMALASSLLLAPAANAAPASGVRLSVCARLADEAKSSPALQAAIQRVERALPAGGQLTVEKLAQAVVDSGVAAERPDMAVSYSVTSSSSTTTGALTASALPALISPPSLCIRVIWGPGRVEWAFPYPKDYGYSVKPESSTNLIWAKEPGQDIDGIYRRAWGSCTALKVPDSATATVRSTSSIEVCQNAAAALAGHVTKWINTCSGPDGAFPDYPL